jgi:hypothetical protein
VNTSRVIAFTALLNTDADSLADAFSEMSTVDGFETMADEVSALLRETRGSPDGETVTVADIRACGLSDGDLKALWEGGLLVADPTDGEFSRTIQFASLARLEAARGRKAA